VPPGSARSGHRSAARVSPPRRCAARQPATMLVVGVRGSNCYPAAIAAQSGQAKLAVPDPSNGEWAWIFRSGLHSAEDSFMTDDRTTGLTSFLPQGEPAPLAYTKSQAAYLSLRARILRGAITPGATLNQENLAAELRVSTTPLREALQRLEAEGLVKLAAHREVVVSPLSGRDIHEIFDVRLQLDPYAGQLAAETATDAQLRAIKSLVPPVRQAGSADPLEQNRNFHRAIYTCSGNQLLADILDSLWDKTDRYRRILLDTDGSTNPNPTHSTIAEALCRRSGAEVKDLIRRHVQAKLDVIMERLASYLSSERR
jgi:DNA-binding GntR family transcriptional regulator